MCTKSLLQPTIQGLLQNVDFIYPPSFKNGKYVSMSTHTTPAGTIANNPLIQTFEPL